MFGYVVFVQVVGVCVVDQCELFEWLYDEVVVCELFDVNCVIDVFLYEVD